LLENIENEGKKTCFVFRRVIDLRRGAIFEWDQQE
jgi:hypothetical protein